jgi:4-hydroxythreonine-4-phosphate dehydrogenase
VNNPTSNFIAITMGDPAGIGPEVILKAVQHEEWNRYCQPVVIGDRRIFERALNFITTNQEKIRISDFHADSQIYKDQLNIIHLDIADPLKCRVGRISQESGAAAVKAVEYACNLALKGEVRGIVTSPLNKEAMHLAGYDYPGHTELLQELTKASHVRMMLVGEKIRVVHNSTHLSMASAIQMVTSERVLDTIRFAHNGCIALGLPHPRIAVAGLNPHAGESGLFGDEETRHISPAVKSAQDGGINAIGPLPPDTVFLRAVKGEFDIVVAMYHDQGHIPIKLLDFDGGVNITFGLPIIRTSVDHGTAFDIAGKGIASEKSLLMAIKMAAQLVSNQIKDEN